jgi:hypothetical protein
MLPQLSQVQITAEEALNYLIISDGNIALAAERAHATPAQLLAILSQQLPAAELQTTLRTLMSIHLYQSVMTTARVYEAALIDLAPMDVAKTYTTLLTLLANITQNTVAPVTINLQETVLKMLPPEIRQTVVNLVQSNPSQQRQLLDD